MLLFEQLEGLKSVLDVYICRRLGSQIHTSLAWAFANQESLNALPQEATSNKCLTTRNKCLTTRNKKLLGTRHSLPTF